MRIVPGRAVAPFLGLVLLFSGCSAATHVDPNERIEAMTKVLNDLSKSSTTSPTSDANNAIAVPGSK